MKHFRTSASLVHDLAIFAMLAQLWLALACCTGQAGSEAHLAFGADSWCSAFGAPASDEGGPKGHNCDCVAACAPATAPVASAAYIPAYLPVGTFVSLVPAMQAEPQSVLPSGAVGSRAPPILR
ncbi:MAG: hypothetical protein EP335_06030 [Alphaproteobacteria bacterium]|nr:MAG: hypothetical protein EP335_06030 [Alphaproteobacteria bacterium]